MARKWCGWAVMWMLALALAVPAGVAQDAPGAAAGEAPLAGRGPAVPLRAFNDKGRLIGRGWAVPFLGGFVTVRTLLAGAARAEIVLSPEQTAEVNAVATEDIEGNLVLFTTEATPAKSLAVSASSGLLDDTETDPVPAELRCGAEANPLKERRSRDVPVFGLVHLAHTAHREPMLGCPVLDPDGAIQAVVVWENPFGKPSVAMVPGSRLSRLSLDPRQPWEAWRALQQQPGRRLHDSLLAEGLQDIWRGDYGLAIESLRFLLEQNPKDARGWYYRGYARAMSGKRELAMGDYEYAVFYDPTNAEAHFSLGFTYAMLRRTLEARQQVKELEPLDPALAERLQLLLDMIAESETHEEAPGLPDSPGPAESPGQPAAPVPPAAP